MQSAVSTSIRTLLLAALAVAVLAGCQPTRPQQPALENFSPTDAYKGFEALWPTMPQVPIHSLRRGRAMIGGAKILWQDNLDGSGFCLTAVATA